MKVSQPIAKTEAGSKRIAQSERLNLYDLGLN